MRNRLAVIGILGLALSNSSVARADTYASDQSAALVVYPGIASGLGVDTLIQISNTSTQLAAVQCYYVNVVGRCSLSDAPCIDIGQLSTECPSDADLCIPNWVETDFKFYITGRQPLAWTASEGLQAADLPLDGVAFRGPTGESNASSRIPPFPETDSGLGAGELKCYVVNGDGTPSDRNVLKGEATLIFEPTADTAKYSALGFRAIEGAVGPDNVLTLGGPEAEYDGCPAVLILNHFFDAAVDPATDGQVFATGLVLVPCTENFVNQVPTSVTAQYLVFNEFEQRFSTSAPVDCFSFSVLSVIDTPDPDRSIFSVFVSGTIAGQTRIRGVNGGLMGLSLESAIGGLYGFSTDASNLHVQGEREASDIITVVQ
jgi:hypothetical protein